MQQLHILEVIGLARLGSIWDLETTDKMQRVVEENYFTARYPEHALRKFDRIMLTCDVAGEGEFGWLVVEENDHGKIMRPLNGGSP